MTNTIDNKVQARSRLVYLIGLLIWPITIELPVHARLSKCVHMYFIGLLNG